MFTREKMKPTKKGLFKAVACGLQVLPSDEGRCLSASAGGRVRLISNSRH